MSKKILHRQPFLQSQSRFGEVVGGTTAICCCCPFGLANILLLVIYKVPASLCRRALKKKKKKKKKRRQHRIKEEEELFPPRCHGCACGSCDENDIRIHPLCSDDMKTWNFVELDKEEMELEKEMWDRFCSTGFWRSSSQRHSSQILTTTVSKPQVEVTTPFTSTW